MGLYDEKNMSTKLDKNNVEDIIALTPIQNVILYHSIVGTESKKYFEQLSLTVVGKIDFDAFSRAWEIIVSQNEMLRAVYKWEKIKVPVQIILKEQKTPVYYHDLSLDDNEDTKQELLKEIKKKDIENGFDLNKGPLFRITLCRLSDDKYEIIISNHHIIYDGWSTGILLNEFANIYEKLVNGQTYKLINKSRFKEHIKQLQEYDYSSAEKFWSEYLKGFDSKTLLPVDHTKEAEITKSLAYKYKLPDSLKEKIDRFTKDNKITLATVIYAAWGLLLQRYNNTEDVLFGITVSGRTKDLNMDNTVGMFINTLPIRIKVSDDKTVVEFLKDVERSLTHINIHSSSSLEMVHKNSSFKNSLFDSIVVVENYPLGEKLFSEKSQIRVQDFSTRVMTNFDLSVAVTNLNSLKLELYYNMEFFERKTIEAMAKHFEKVLLEIISESKEMITEVEMITDSEKEKIIKEFKGADVEYQKNKTLHQIFEEQADLVPDKCAVIFKDESLTYRELNEKANQLARKLVKKGLKPDDLVGLVAERSLEMIIGIMAIIKAGGAYLPIDPAYPEERIQFMLEDGNVQIILTQDRFMDKVDFKGETINIEDENLYNGDSSNLGEMCSPHNLIYVIYTSGSTGKPKGVMVEHQSLINQLEWQKDVLKLDDEDIVMQKTTITFDVSVLEIFMYFFVQASLCLLPPGMENNPEEIISTIEKHKVTLVNFVPSMLNAFLYYVEGRMLKDRLASLRHIVSGGEELKVSYIDSFNKYINVDKKIKLHNIYGPTEATIDVTYFNCKYIDKYPSVPIGKPVNNTRIYILDKYGNMQPPCVPGELCIAGDSLTRGYLNREELTKEKFVNCPYEKDGKMYKTGDLVSWFEDGEIKYLGRIDSQVKVRGFRIELGEIEECISKYELVKEAAVIVEGEEKQNEYIAAYIVAKSKFETKDLKTYLGKILPTYMVPARYIYIDVMPLTSSGKINRKMLKDKNKANSKGVENLPPKDEIEKKLLDICCKTLNTECSSMNENLYELGANSLIIIQLASMIYKEFKVEIPIKEFFRKLTIIELADLIKNTDKVSDALKITPTLEEEESQAGKANVDNEDKAIENTMKSEEKVREELAELWKKTLEVDTVKVSDNFFYLNGNSLKATKLITHIYHNFKVELSLDEIFEYCTLDEMTKCIIRHEKDLYMPIKKVKAYKYYPLSSAQTRLFIEYFWNRNSTSYNVSSVLKIEGNLDYVKFDDCVQKIVRRHETLRTTFEIVEGVPVQNIHEKIDFAVIKEDALDRDIKEIVHEFIKPFDLSKAPLFRVKVVKCNKGQYILFDMHHIILDGASINNLMSEFIRLYQGEVLSPLPIQYKDYIVWQKKYLESEDMKRQEKYWLDVFKDGVPVLNLPTDYERPKIRNNEGEMLCFDFESTLTKDVKEVTSKYDVTNFMLFLSIYSIILAKDSKQNDMTIGVPVIGRKQKEIEPLIGYFVNTLALRIKLLKSKKYTDFLSEVKESVLEGITNQFYPLEQIFEKLHLKRDLSRNGLFDAMFSLQINYNFQLEDLKFSQCGLESHTSKFDLHLAIVQRYDKIVSFGIEYNKSLFKEATVEKIGQDYKAMVEKVVKNPDVTLEELLS